MKEKIITEKEKQKKVKSIYLSSGIVSICGIVYQVLYGAAGSILFGDSVLYYCVTIGLFLMGMGFGAGKTERVQKYLLNKFIQIEYGIALVGSISVLGLFFISSNPHLGQEAAQLFLYIVIGLTGFLTGIELPILIREAEKTENELSKSTARVLFFDYAGSLIGAIGFALVLRPWLGLIKTGFFVAIINVLVALWIAYKFKNEIKNPKMHQISGAFLTIMLIVGFVFGEDWSKGFEAKLYDDPICYNQHTKYQQILMTCERNDLRLFLNGQLQASESDEKRYHEALVHIPMQLAEKKTKVLLLGGGDGFAVREVLKYGDEVKSIELVDLDPKMTKLAQIHPELLRINKGSLNHQKVKIHNKDAFTFLLNNKEFYDVILVDLPDPDNEGLNKLYTDGFYKLIRNHLLPGGYTSIQSTSPVFATKAFWTISETVKASGMTVQNYHLDVPSFGNWGFTLASRNAFTMKDIKNIQLDNIETEYLNEETIPSLFAFAKDEDYDIIEKGKKFKYEVNTLNRPILMELYSKAWEFY